MTAVTIYRGDTGMSAGVAEITRRLGAVVAPELSVGHPTDAASLLAQEQAVQRAVHLQADLLIARRIVLAHCDEAWKRLVFATARQQVNPTLPRGVRLRNKGCKTVHIRLQNGLILTMATPYMRPMHTQQGRKSKASYRGRFPILHALGLEKHATPALRERCARQLVLSDSFIEAQEQLARDGLIIHTHTILLLALYLGRRAVKLQQEALDNAIKAPLSTSSPLQGRRVQVSIDGGRARTRLTDEDAPVGNNGRRPFTTAWREPRIVTLTVLDATGQQDRRIRPVYVVSLGDADAVMKQVVGLLRHLGAHLAARVVFVCDGALWLWRRLEPVVCAAGLLRHRVVLVLDFWHACQYIHKALVTCKNMKADQREQLYGTLRRLLRDHELGAEQVIGHLKKLARGRRAREINERIAYLTDHITHMRYAMVRADALPIGSGVVESAVRRIINLRFKSASMFWRAEHLEPLLTLRALLKSGRWKDFCQAEMKDQFWLPRDGKAFQDKEKKKEKAA